MRIFIKCDLLYENILNTLSEIPTHIFETSIEFFDVF